ncbi:MAG: hypothetical protein HYX34_04950 [Actinobacteria bacterium]|nr:hypothetical protein [Actinomycetota bacterium]
MTVGVSILLFVIGAVLKYAITDNINNVDLATIGVILMIAGAVGFVVSLVYMLSTRGRGDVAHVEQRRVYNDPI